MLTEVERRQWDYWGQAEINDNLFGTRNPQNPEDNIYYLLEHFNTNLCYFNAATASVF